MDMMQKEDRSLGSLIGTSPFREEDAGRGEAVSPWQGCDGHPEREKRPKPSEMCADPGLGATFRPDKVLFVKNFENIFIILN